MAIIGIEWIGDYPFIEWQEEWERLEDAACCYPSERYACGMAPPNYPVPALADTATVLCLGHIANQWQYLAWDKIWRDELPDYIR